MDSISSKISLKSLIRSFQYDLPRANICCNVAKHFYLPKYFGSSIDGKGIEPDYKVENEIKDNVLIDLQFDKALSLFN